MFYVERNWIVARTVEIRMTGREDEGFILFLSGNCPFLVILYDEILYTKKSCELLN